MINLIYRVDGLLECCEESEEPADGHDAAGPVHETAQEGLSELQFFLLLHKFDHFRTVLLLQNSQNFLLRLSYPQVLLKLIFYYFVLVTRKPGLEVARLSSSRFAAILLEFENLLVPLFPQPLGNFLLFG